MVKATPFEAHPLSFWKVLPARHRHSKITLENQRGKADAPESLFKEGASQSPAGFLLKRGGLGKVRAGTIVGATRNALNPGRVNE